MSKNSRKKFKPGWWTPEDAKKSHFMHDDSFANLPRSLCKKWGALNFDIQTDDYHNHENNCGACKKKLPAFLKSMEKTNE